MAPHGYHRSVEKGRAEAERGGHDFAAYGASIQRLGRETQGAQDRNIATCRLSGVALEDLG